MEFRREEIDQMEKVKRLNLINSITGIKPANLIGTRSEKGHENLAIFNSVVHLGSNPPLIGCVSRPIGDFPRHTYRNIIAQGAYTINAVPLNMTKQGHYTSAKFEVNESEFDNCGFTAQYKEGFKAPFVKESAIQIGLKLVEEIEIKSNGTVMLVGEVEYLFVTDNMLTNEGYLDLEEGNIAGISGLNSYYELKKQRDYPFARKEHWLSSAT